MLQHYKYQTLEQLGFSSSYSDQISKKIIQRLKNRKHLRWVKKVTIEDEIRQYFKNKRIPMIWGIPPIILRTVSQKISAFILKQCAKEQGLLLTNIRPDDNNAFIVHEYMNPWTFMEEHIVPLSYAKKEHFIWQEPEHKQWKEQLITKDTLIDNMIELFEAAFSSWLEKGLIVRIAEKSNPVKSVLYRINANEKFK